MPEPQSKLSVILSALQMVHYANPRPARETAPTAQIADQIDYRPVRNSATTRIGPPNLRKYPL